MGSISRWPKARKATKDLNEHLKMHKSGVLQITDAVTKKKFQKEVLNSFPQHAALFANTTLPPSDWAGLVYSPYFFGFAANHVSVSMSHMCCMEARMVLHGSEYVAGIPYVAVDGATLKEKRKALLTMPTDTLRNLIQNSGGFAFLHDSTKLAVLPTGMIMIYASSGCTGIRWSLAGDEADTNRVQLHLKHVIEAFPEMATPSTGYSQWQAWLASL